VTNWEQEEGITQKVLPVEKSKEILRFLKSGRYRDPALPITLDDYWFYFPQDFEQQSLSTDAALPIGSEARHCHQK
jgi:hypothetical protein